MDYNVQLEVAGIHLIFKRQTLLKCGEPQGKPSLTPAGTDLLDLQKLGFCRGAVAVPRKILIQYRVVYKILYYLM